MFERERRAEGVRDEQLGVDRATDDDQRRGFLVLLHLPGDDSSAEFHGTDVMEIGGHSNGRCTRSSCACPSGSRSGTSSGTEASK